MAGNSKLCITKIINWKFVTQKIETYSEICQTFSGELKQKK